MVVPVDMAHLVKLAAKAGLACLVALVDLAHMAKKAALARPVLMVELVMQDRPAYLVGMAVWVYKVMTVGLVASVPLVYRVALGMRDGKVAWVGAIGLVYRGDQQSIDSV